jgi:D-sedoheptulose 7-phosphate isomerase
MYSKSYLAEITTVASLIDAKAVEALVVELIALRKAHGRLYLAGLGGSAANCSHAANDFRKLCAIEAYSISDNVAELTARANDEGWDTIFSGALQFALGKDALMIFSVGGGTSQVSRPIVEAIKEAKKVGMKVFGIVGPNGGITREQGDCVIRIPALTKITPHTEAFQAVIWHCLVSHPDLQRKATKW